MNMTPIKMPDENLRKIERTQLLQGGNAATCNTKKRREQGSILLFFLPWLVLLCFLLFAFSSLSIHIQSAIALEARLDVCALEIAHSRIKLFHYLSDTNASLKKIRIAIEAIRGTKIIPVIGELGSVAEPELVELATLIKLSQDTMVAKQSIEERLKLFCAQNQFSNSTASCLLQAIDESQLQREVPFFPDIPGRISLISANQTLLQIKCMGFFSRKIVESKIAIRGDPNLFERDFNYVYE